MFSFRKFRLEESPAAGELWVRAARSEDRKEAGLSRLVFSQGLGVLDAGSGPIERIVIDAGKVQPTLDEMLTAEFARLLLGATPLNSCFAKFAEYAALLRKGVTPTELPLEESLEGIFLAMRYLAGEDLTDAESGAGFLKRWSRLWERIAQAAAADLDVFRKSLFTEGGSFAEEISHLRRAETLFRHDVQRGVRWKVLLPGESVQVSGLLLRSPRCPVFKECSRRDKDTPTGEPYSFLAVHWLRDNHWVFSVDPVVRRGTSLKTLADAFTSAESDGGTGSPTWYDGSRQDHTLVASPENGTRLKEPEILGVLHRWARIKPDIPGRSVKLPSWILKGAAAFLVLIAVAVGYQRWSTRGEGGEKDGSSGQQEKGQRRRDDKTAVLDRNARLHIFAVGICQYAESTGLSPLSYAGEDAKDFAATLSTVNDPSKVAEAVVLTDESGEATHDGILEKLVAMGKQVQPGDFVVLFLSGHGLKNDSGHYYFLPQNYKKNSTVWRGVSWHAISEVLNRLDSPVLIVLDTCHAGAAGRSKGKGDDPELRDAVERSRYAFDQSPRDIFVLAACTASQSAKEAKDWKHGALTLAVLEWLRGTQEVEVSKSSESFAMLQRRPHEGSITLADLAEYARVRVGELVEGSQAVLCRSVHGDAAPQHLLIGTYK